MDIFVSWSGARSRAVAEALKEYLPIIVNAFNPWLSSADIDKGTRWISELSEALLTAKAGIVCLTPNNLNAPYILFEAGAISKTVGKSRVCPLLIGMEPSDVTGPLSQFQATKTTKAEFLQLVQTLNKALGDSAVKDQQLEISFDLCWPKLSERLEKLPPDGPSGRPKRGEREMLEELVDSVRSSTAETAKRIGNLSLEMEAANLSLIDRVAEIRTLVTATLQKQSNSPPGQATASTSTLVEEIYRTNPALMKAFLKVYEMSRISAPQTKTARTDPPKGDDQK